MREYRILLSTAGAGNAINVVRSLKKAFDDQVYVVGTNITGLELAKSNADKNYIVPRFNDASYSDVISKIIEKERIDFFIPNHEFEIEVIRNKYEHIAKKCFLPSKETVRLCVDKFELIDFLKYSPYENYVPESFMLQETTDLSKKYDYPLWVRLTRGAGSRGATLVYDSSELVSWVYYWQNHHEIYLDDFMISEYLPHNDYHYFSLWKDGEMIIGKAIQRMQYCCSKYTLTGTSSSPSLCKMIADKSLDELTEGIIKTIDRNANGLFGIDYKCRADGTPCLTEINIGRFPRINYIFNFVGPNIAEYFVYCGMGLNFEKPQKHVIRGDEWYLFRDFDLGLTLKHRDELHKYSVIH